MIIDKAQVLVDSLRLATKELKEEYLKQIEKWSKQSFQTMLKMMDEVKENEKQLRKISDGRYEWNKWIEEWVSLPSWSSFIKGKEGSWTENKKGKFLIHPRLAEQIFNKYYNQEDVKYVGQDVHIEKMLKHAENHYEGSLVKLAQRIIKKGLNISKMTMKSGFMDMNLEIEMTDGEKSVKAWTIIASGMIQKPHYRYLVK